MTYCGDGLVVGGGWSLETADGSGRWVTGVLIVGGTTHPYSHGLYGVSLELLPHDLPNQDP